MESQVVELYEHEMMEGKIWKSYEKNPWVNKKTLDQSPPPDEINPPGAEWNWESNWKIEKRAGFTDEDGWEYASKTRKFYSSYARQVKSEGKPSDKARRRVWCRVMRREASNKQLDIQKVIPRIQAGLTGIHQARMQIDDILKKSTRTKKYTTNDPININYQ